jgi:hypothetical protein
VPTTAMPSAGAEPSQHRMHTMHARAGVRAWACVLAFTSAFVCTCVSCELRVSCVLLARVCVCSPIASPDQLYGRSERGADGSEDRRSCRRRARPRRCWHQRCPVSTATATAARSRRKHERAVYGDELVRVASAWVM